MKWLKYYREKSGLSMQKLSEMLDVQLNTIWRWENGKASPSVDVATALAKIFGISESELLHGPSEGKVKITLVYDWTHMEGGKIDMNGNEFELILGSQGQIGLKGAAQITSAEAIEEFLARVKEQLTIALDAQVRRGAIPQA